MTDPNNSVNAMQYTSGGIIERGLSKREYFAALAMQGLLAQHGATFGSYHIATFAIEHADALIENLNKEQE